MPECPSFAKILAVLILLPALEHALDVPLCASVGARRRDVGRGAGDRQPHAIPFKSASEAKV